MFAISLNVEPVGEPEANGGSVGLNEQGTGLFLGFGTTDFARIDVVSRRITILKHQAYGSVAEVSRY